MVASLAVFEAIPAAGFLVPFPCGLTMTFNTLVITVSVLPPESMRDGKTDALLAVACCANTGIGSVMKADVGQTGCGMRSESCFGKHPEPVLAWASPQGIAVVKPAGMHTAPGGRADGSSLADWVFQRYPEAAEVKGRLKGEGGLIHRLDRDTEGLVLFALTEGFFASLVEQSAAGSFQKSYLALAVPGCGGLDGSRPLLSAPSGVNEQLWVDALRRQDLARLSAMLSGTRIEGRFRPYGIGSRRVACSLTAVPGSTKSWTRDSYLTTIQASRPCEGGILVDVRLSRGFRHQVRAHLAWVGLSLQGDKLYGEGEENRDPELPGSGLRLLAHSLAFCDPVSGTPMTISLPDFAGQDFMSGAC
jgi:23S rRNA pseudouridine1911/1915/1917 synthase